MTPIRLTRTPYLAIWAVLTGAQLFALTTWAGDNGPLAAAVVIALQVAKLPLSVGRLDDLGRSPDDAWLGLVPLANLGLFRQLLAGSPTPELRDKRRGSWAGEPLATGAFGRGLLAVVRTLWLTLPLAVSFAVVEVLGGYAFVDALSRAEATAIEPVAMALAVVLGLYTALQFPKRHTASRASWLPSLFLLPAILVTLAFRFGAASGPITPALLFYAWTLAFRSVVGATMAVAWITIGDQLRKGRVQPSVVLGRALRRTVDVAAPHGGAYHAVAIGMQVVIPGIHYALQYAFVDQVAVHEPDSAALKRSSALTRGIRRRLFVLLGLGVGLGMLISLPISLSRDGASAVMESLTMLPTAISPTTALMTGTLAILLDAAVEIGLLELYRARTESHAQNTSDEQAV